MSKANEKQLTKVDTSLYISDAALDAIYSLEGHDKDGVDANGVPTTYYGITDKGLSKMKELRNTFNVDVPKELLTAKRDKLTKAQARQVAAYCAVHNSMLIDRHFGDEHTFMRLPLHIRSAVLTDYHRGGVPKIADSWKDENARGSIMKAFQSGSREQIALALIQNSDGSIMSNYKNDGKNSQRNRHLAAIRLMYDTVNNSFPTIKAAGALTGKWQNQPGYIKSIEGTLKSLGQMMDARRERNESAMRTLYWGVANKETMADKSQQAIENLPQKEAILEDATSGELTEAGVLSDFTNAMKNLLNYFGIKDTQNAAQRNENVNMQ